MRNFFHRCHPSFIPEQSMKPPAFFLLSDFSLTSSLEAFLVAVNLHAFCNKIFKLGMWLRIECCCVEVLFLLLLIFFEFLLWRCKDLAELIFLCPGKTNRAKYLSIFIFNPQKPSSANQRHLTSDFDWRISQVRELDRWRPATSATNVGSCDYVLRSGKTVDYGARYLKSQRFFLPLPAKADDSNELTEAWNSTMLFPPLNQNFSAPFFGVSSQPFSHELSESKAKWPVRQRRTVNESSQANCRWKDLIRPGQEWVTENAGRRRFLETDPKTLHQRNFYTVLWDVR